MEENIDAATPKELLSTLEGVPPTHDTFLGKTLRRQNEVANVQGPRTLGDQALCGTTTRLQSSEYEPLSKLLLASGHGTLICF